MEAIALTGNDLTLQQLREIVLEKRAVTLDKKTLARLAHSRKYVETAAKSDEKIYSINTGFGILSKVKIPKDQLAQLQLNIVRSHAANVGEPMAEEESRAMLLLRANVLAKGYSGVRPELAQLLVDMLNRRVHPVIPCQGSVGSSGDLSPLSHLALVVIGEGEAFFQGIRLPGDKALKKAGLEPLTLAAKEGLALINGTQQMTALAALTLLQAEEMIDVAEVICTTSLEGILGTRAAYAAWIQDARPHPGQKRSAQLLSDAMDGSEIAASHAGCDRVQDPYSLRCAPQVHGACRDLLSFVRNTVAVELNAATDNPLVNPETGEIVSGGNFHGQPIAFALDILGMAMAEIGSISERRTAKLINPVFSELPTFLVKNEGLNSGFMIPQYTAASLVVENRGLTHPASTDSIPTNNDKEDHNSMGPIAARKAQRIFRNTSYILGIEALTACQALEFRKPLKPGKGPRALYKMVRESVLPLNVDRAFSQDIETVAEWIRDGRLHARLTKEIWHHERSALAHLRKHSPVRHAKRGRRKTGKKSLRV